MWLENSSLITRRGVTNGFNNGMPMEKVNILIGENELIFPPDIQSSLEREGYVVVGHINTAESAIQLAGDLHPDLVLMDIDLKGGMDGVEAARQIGARFDLPVVFQAASPDPTVLARALQAQPYGYIGKPYQEPELFIVMELAVARHAIDRKLHENEQRYDLAVRGTNDGLWDWDLLHNTINYSPRWKAMLGFKEDEISSSPEEWLKRVHLDDQRRLYQNLGSHLKGKSPRFECEFQMQDARGRYVWMLARGLAERDGLGKPYRMAGLQTDVTSQKLVEERMAYGALHDGLTGLPNRELFMDRLSQRVEFTKRHPDSSFAVIFLDIDRFKVVNDSLGHAMGDQLLISLARRLQLCLRPEDTLSRLGGDEFAILLHEVSDVNDAIRVAERFQARIKETTVLSAVSRTSSVSIGIVLFNKIYTHPQDILRDADTAMYRAKALGGGCYQVFNTSMHTKAVELLHLEADMKRAVANQEWQVYYQPILSMTSGGISGVEALVRWNHPKRGMLLPMEFIHEAEDVGLILPIGEFVLHTACLQARAWRGAGHSSLWVSVNLSGRQFQDHDLVQKVSRILAETGLPSDGLRLEVTESVAMQDLSYSIDVMNELNGLGVQVFMDDFGNGYSSLSYLKRFPLKALKIDQSFIQDIMLNKNSEAITVAIIAMAHSLGLEVIAEGVEKDDQKAFLKGIICDHLQGFLFSEPLPGKELTNFLQKSLRKIKHLSENTG
jgi:diguanylate cyclase (GGDEF)-like protein/PAS domain S-box-containing protein